MLSLRNVTALTPDGLRENTSLLIEGDRIAGLGKPVSADSPGLDLAGLLAAPGYIDLQLNGGFGHDFTADAASLWAVAARLPEHGVTAFLPTLITSPLEQVRAAQAVLQAGPPPGFQGAEPLGLHLEGPFLNPERRGAHNPAYLLRPEPRLVTEWSPATGVRLVTLAPELDLPALETIKGLRANGVVVSAGHSMATFEQASQAFEAGATYGTHVFNAMTPLEHRAPGLATALLTDRRPTVGLIPDGIHLHPAIVRLIWQARGPHGVNVVTDAMMALGMPPGRYGLGDFAVTVDEHTARLPDGRLAGSILSLDQAVRNLVAYTGCSPSEALATVTSVPADVLGLSDRGRLAPGYLADIVCLDAELKVALTIAGGQIAYSRQALPAPHAL